MLRCAGPIRSRWLVMSRANDLTALTSYRPYSIRIKPHDGRIFLPLAGRFVLPLAPRRAAIPPTLLTKETVTAHARKRRRCMTMRHNLLTTAVIIVLEQTVIQHF